MSVEAIPLPERGHYHVLSLASRENLDWSYERGSGLVLIGGDRPPKTGRAALNRCSVTS